MTEYKNPQEAIKAGEVIGALVPGLEPILVVAAVMRPDGRMVWADGHFVDPMYSGHSIHETSQPLTRIRGTIWQDGRDGPKFFVVTPEMYDLIDAAVWRQWLAEHPDVDPQALLEKREEHEARSK